MRIDLSLLVTGIALSMVAGSPLAAQTSSSTSGGASGPCVVSSQPDVCVTAGTPTDVPEPDMALTFGVAVGVLMLARRFGRRPRD